VVQIDGAANVPVDNDYAKFTANGLEGQSYAELRSDVGVIFEENANVIREHSDGGYDNDFVVGSPQLDDDGVHDARMFFDKSKRAFRAGLVTGNEWDAANIGDYSHAEGYNTLANGTNGCHAEGIGTTASGNISHAEGLETTASGNTSHAEGAWTNATGEYTHAEGAYSTASGIHAHAEGYITTASSNRSHAEGYYSNAYLDVQHAKASGRFTATGDAQLSNLVARNATTNAVQTELFLDGSSVRAILPADRTWAFTINIAARQTAASPDGTVGDSGIYKIEGGIKRDGANNTALVGSITKTILAEDQAAWDVTAEADDANEALVVKVTGSLNMTIQHDDTLGRRNKFS
jgi:hypothetical protein